MVKKINYLIIPACIILFLILVSGIINAAEQIRPAPQTESRGVGEQIRPANQQNLPSDGNGDYKPTQGSDYSSGYDKKYDVKMESELKNSRSKVNIINSTTNETISSNANGTAFIVVNTKKNTLDYNITYNNLSSKETEAHISDSSGTEENILFSLPLGIKKIGTWIYDEIIESSILGGKISIDIHSLLFPEGELSGNVNVKVI